MCLLFFAVCFIVTERAVGLPAPSCGEAGADRWRAESGTQASPASGHLRHRSCGTRPQTPLRCFRRQPTRFGGSLPVSPCGRNGPFAPAARSHRLRLWGCRLSAQTKPPRSIRSEEIRCKYYLLPAPPPREEPPPVLPPKPPPLREPPTLPPKPPPLDPPPT